MKQGYCLGENRGAGLGSIRIECRIENEKWRITSQTLKKFAAVDGDDNTGKEILR